MNNNLLKCAQLLIDKNLTIAFAESATAGRMASEFSLLKNAGKFLKGGIICYDAEVKKDLLNVSDELVEKYSPDSIEVTRAAAIGLPSLFKADVYIAVMGLPDTGGSETDEKLVGTMFLVANYGNTELFAEKIVFSGQVEDVIKKTINCTAKLLVSHLNKYNL